MFATNDEADTPCYTVVLEGTGWAWPPDESMQITVRLHELDSSVHFTDIGGDNNLLKMEPEQHVNVMREYFDLAHAEPVPSEAWEWLVMYKSSRVRTVFDTSAKSASGTSLNDHLSVGPTVHSLYPNCSCCPFWCNECSKYINRFLKTSSSLIEVETWWEATQSWDEATELALPANTQTNSVSNAWPRHQHPIGDRSVRIQGQPT